MINESSEQDPIILVDGSWYLYRAYHALPPLMTSNKQPTGAIRGVVSMIKKIIQDHPNSPLAVVFDSKGKTFRHEMYKEYKANRPPMPEDLIEQIEPIYKIIKALVIHFDYLTLLLVPGLLGVAGANNPHPLPVFSILTSETVRFSKRITNSCPSYVP